MARILLVEDDPDLSEIWAELLEGLGYDVLPVASMAALREAAIEDVQVAVIDWSLPDGSGADALAEIALRSPTAKIVITTGHGPETVPEEISGVSDVLRKPFRVRELRRVISILTAA